MTSATSDLFLRRGERVSLFTAIVGLVLSVAVGWTHPSSLAPAYRFAAIACLEPAVGSLIFLLIYQLTGGQWGRPLLPFLGAGVRLLPWCWVALLPLLYWDRNSTRTIAPDQHLLRLYLTHSALIARSVVYTILFFLFRWAVNPFLPPTRPSSTQSIPAAARRIWVGPVGLILLTFMMHLLAVDWLLATEPDWTSTGFPLVWLAGQAVAGFSLAVAVAIYAGADPGERGPTGGAFGLDWGNLLLTTIMFWVYVAFVQLLIIWSGNLPRETSWYLHRWHGGWRGILIGVVCFHFGVPFFLLLSRELKRRASGLRTIAALIFAMQMLYVAWMLLPSYPWSGFAEYSVAAALFATALGLFLNRYFFFVRGALLPEAGR